MFRRFMIVCWVFFGLATALAIVSGCDGSAVRDQAAIDPVIQAAPRAPMEGRTPEDRLLVIYGLDEQKGLIDTQGRIVVEPRFDWARSSSEGRAMVRRNARSGFVDGTGRIVIDLTWDEALIFSEGLAIVATGIKRTFNRSLGLPITTEVGQRGYIDRDGNVVITPRFRDARRFSEGVAWVADGDKWKWGLIDRKGEYLIEPRFEVEPKSGFSEGLCPVWLGGRWSSEQTVERFGYIDMTGTTVIPPQFRGAGGFSEGIAPIVKGGKLGFIDRAGEILIEPQFDWPYVSLNTRLPTFSEGLAVVPVDGRDGFIDKTGRITIEPRYESAKGFREGLAAVRLDGKTGFIDREGRMIIEPRFRSADSFEGGIASVLLEIGRWGYIRRDGSFIWNPLTADELAMPK